jgi:hypothetical protein
MPDAILYTRQPDGTYTKTGELPKGARLATVVSSVDTGVPSTIKCVKDWELILDCGPLKQEWYKIIPADAPHRMTDEAKEKLTEINRRRKAERKVR